MPDPAAGARVAVIGAGISGLVCARELAARGIEIVVYEKARGPGGRLATRRVTKAAGNVAELPFDHGAQYFTVRDPVFRRQVAEWQALSLVAPWLGKIVAIEKGAPRPLASHIDRYVGLPRMSAITRHLADEVARMGTVELSRQIVGMSGRNGTWRLQDDEGRRSGAFDRVVVALPAPQAAGLLEPAPALLERARSVRFAPCWAAMVAFGERFDGAFVNGERLSWIARDSSKTGRPEGERWVLHGSPEWSATVLETGTRQIAADLLDSFAEVMGVDLPTPLVSLVHRWRYAQPINPLEERCLFDFGRGLGACGDWCGGPRVEGAFSSGLAMAERLLTQS